MFSAHLAEMVVIRKFMKFSREIPADMCRRKLPGSSSAVEVSTPLHSPQKNYRNGLIKRSFPAGNTSSAITRRR